MAGGRHASATCSTRFKFERWCRPQGAHSRIAMSDEFRLLMLSAMYENGGNTTHRFLDGHPQMFVYPFESQIGTRLVNDALSSTFPVKYRWPVFALDAT